MLSTLDLSRLVSKIEDSDHATIAHALNMAKQNATDLEASQTRRVTWKAIAKLLQSELRRF